jgi:hypothetical protein
MNSSRVVTRVSGRACIIDHVRAACTGVVLLVACGRIDFATETSDAPIQDVPFCATVTPAPTFCSDFEDGSDDAWTDSDSFGGSVAVLASAGHASRFGLAATTQQLATSGDTVAVDENFLSSPTASTVALALDLNVASVGTGDLVIVSLDLEDAVQHHTLEYVYRMPTMAGYLEDVVTPMTGSGSFDSYPFTEPLAGEWHHVEIDVTTGINAACTILDNGAVVLSTPVTGKNTGSIALHVGAPFLSGPANPWQVDLDNVVLQSH